MKKFYVFGDSSGWYEPIAQSLMSIGVDLETMIIPKDVEIVHLGDLIHKGKYSEKLFTLVHLLMVSNNNDPERGNWIQLMGNHEANYFAEAPLFWDYELSEKHATLLRLWHQKGLLKLVHVLDTTEGRPFVLSHAGISKDFFNFDARTLESLATSSNGILANAMENMNIEFQKDLKRFSRPGEMLGAHGISHVSPFWANTVKEVIPTWGNSQPFNQIVGHITPFIWDKKRFFLGIPKHLLQGKYFSVTEKESITVFYYLNGSKIFFLDPGYSDNESSIPTHQPYLTINQSGEVETKLSKWKGHRI